MGSILVTGATGFIGQHVINSLLAQSSHQVIATSMRPTQTFWDSRVRYIPFDYTMMEAATDYFRFLGSPDAMIHLAWPGLPNYTEDFHISTNLPTQFRFLENMVQHGLKNLTVSGTCFEYGMQEGELREDMQTLPSNQYAIAKDMLRQKLEGLRGQYEFSLKWVRLFYLYGPGQSPKSLLSQLQKAISDGDSVFNMSPGDQLRDYLPVEKVAKYLVAIALQTSVDGIINCCSGKPVTVLKVVQDYLESTQQRIALNLGYYPYNKIEPRNFWGNTEKLNKILIHEQSDRGL